MPVGPAQELVGGTGLRIAHVPGGRGILTIVFTKYEDSDLGAYDELGLVFYVRGPAGRGVHITDLPVNEEFTLAAGREIWGFPKVLADIAIKEGPASGTCTLRQDGRDVLRLEVLRGIAPLPQPALKTYTLKDGRLHVTRWRSRGLAKARLVGGLLELGDHPLADRLRSLGLRRPRMSSSVARFRASFGPASPVSPGG